MKSPEAVLFDVGGTLVWMPALVGTIRRVLHAHGVEIDEETIAVRHKLLSEATEFPDETSSSFYEDFNRKLLRSLGVPRADWAQEIHDACSQLSWDPCPDVHALGRLAVRMGVVSNWDRSLDDVLHALPLTFDVIVGSSTEAVRKPDPAAFRIAAERLDLPPDRIAYVGDSIYLDVEPAQAVGMTAVLVDRLGIFGAHTSLRTSDLWGLARLLRLPLRAATG